MGSRLYPRAIQPGHDASKITKQTTIHNFLLHVLLLPFDNPNPVPLDQVYLMLEQLGFQIGCAGGKRTCDITTYFSQESPCDFPGKTKPCYRHAKWAFQRYLMGIRTARSGKGHRCTYGAAPLWCCQFLRSDRNPRYRLRGAHASSLDASGPPPRGHGRST